MKTDTTHETAVTQSVEAAGVRFAFRRIGAATSPPIVFCHRFRGTMDDWDPTVINGLAKDRAVSILVNAGIGLFTGTTPTSVKGMAECAAHFIEALGLSQVDGWRYWDRLTLRTAEPVEPPVPVPSIQAQVAAIMTSTQGIDSAFSRLGEIKQPVLVVNGSNDVMIPTYNSFLMAQRIPKAQLIVYPDSGHGALLQYPEQLVRHGLDFLGQAA